MGRCWKRSETGSEESQCTDGVTTVSPKFPQKTFWTSLTATLLLVAVVFSLTVQQLGLRRHSAQPLQVVRITVPDQSGALINQSALVDKENDLVTFSVTSQVNHTSTVLFDVKHGLICYKPDNQASCFLREMEMADYENMHSLLEDATHKESPFLLLGNETRRQTEFLGVLGGSAVDLSTLDTPLQDLCRQRSVHWTRKSDGPGRQRLVYFCIDICFPSNICVSVCFYYLPE